MEPGSPQARPRSSSPTPKARTTPAATALPGPNYSMAKDRGAAVGANAWNRAGPDGHIDVPNDILPAVLQYNHRCDSAG